MSTRTQSPPATLTVRDVFAYDTFTRPGVLITRVATVGGTMLTDRYSAVLEDVLTDDHLGTDLLEPLPVGAGQVQPWGCPAGTDPVPEDTWFAVSVLAPLLRSGLQVRALPGTRAGSRTPLPLLLAGRHVGWTQPADPTRATAVRRADGRVPGLCTLAEGRQVVDGARPRMTSEGWDRRLARLLDG